jgi:hypothetical protein
MADKIKLSFFTWDHKHSIANPTTFRLNLKNHTSQIQPDLSFSKNKDYNEAQPFMYHNKKKKNKNLPAVREERRALSWGNQRRGGTASPTPSLSTCALWVFDFFDDDSQYLPSACLLLFYVFVFAFLKAKRKSRWGWQQSAEHRNFNVRVCLWTVPYVRILCLRFECLVPLPPFV